MALALSTLKFASLSHAQTPLSPPATPDGGPVQVVPGLPPALPTTPMIVSGNMIYPDAAEATSGARCAMSCRETMRESLFGDASAEGKWRPLSLGTFFTEGWCEPGPAAPPVRRA
ncbi:MAG: hypothetical protein ACJ8C4_21040 [Gemmataceae bacterium]